ncbi:MAG: LLM class flavin-dependent oxidoreductase [Chitinophagaceae bacterium]
MTNKNLSEIPFSVLDLAPITEGNTAATSFKNTLALAQRVEELGYHRYWLAEHHNMDSVASSATAVLIGYVANGTKTIRVGSGGIMLPNHAPLIVAEQFGTLASLFPNRIDLGLGRAPGTDQPTAMALRRGRIETVQDFPADIRTLQQLFSAENRNSKVRAIPGEGLDVPIWILGSSTDSARLAAQMGLPYAFASHFAPAQFLTAIDIYRRNFQASEALEKPYVMACVNVIAADTNEEAQYLSSSFLQLLKGIVTGKRSPLPPPVADVQRLLGDEVQALIHQMMYYSFIGDAQKVKDGLAKFQAAAQVDEIMVTSHIYNPAARLHSYEVLRGAMKS